MQWCGCPGSLTTSMLNMGLCACSSIIDALMCMDMVCALIVDHASCLMFVIALMQQG